MKNGLKNYAGMSYALITGASSGIGYEFCHLFAKKGFHLILVARKKRNLSDIAKNIEARYTVKSVIIPIDLSLPEAAGKIYEQVVEKSISVEYLVNNAGFYVKGGFTETSWEDEMNLISLQCLNHVMLTKLFLPGMLAAGKGGVLNVGSTGSFAPGPYNAVYCAAKSFVLSFSEALAQEVSGSNVSVTALCPGGTKTDFQDLSKRKRSVFFPLMKASTVAEAGYNGLMKGKRLVVPGWANKILVSATRFLPRKWVSGFNARWTDE